MGVPKFFRYISERYPCLSELVKEYQIPGFDHLYLDMNGIIHSCSHPDDSDPTFRITEEKIFQDIFHYIEILFQMIKPQKLFFMAVDGVAPRAKMNQQRGRRFRAAKDAEKLDKEARTKMSEMPTTARFDSNCITPGTIFMTRLNEQLQYFVSNKISTDKLWQKCVVILSGHDTPGEGEHKIMEYIRYMRSQPGYDSNTRHCLYGLDADLIMLGLCSHEPHFSLLREEVKFGKKSLRKSSPENTTFYLLHLSLMREYLQEEFRPLVDKLPFEYNLENIIDDWVLMGFLVGNDFIPNLPNLHISSGAMPRLYKIYMDVLPSLDGYLNDSGTINLKRFEKFMKSLTKIDYKNFEETYDDLQYFKSKTGHLPTSKERKSYKPKELEAWDAEVVDNDEIFECLEPDNEPVNKDLAALIKETSDFSIDDPAEPSITELNKIFLSNDDDGEEKDMQIEMEFQLHKKNYYETKMHLDKFSAETLVHLSYEYIRALQWILHYYYDGVCSWSWFYPYHYAPYISDIKGYTNMNFDFDFSKPFLPYEQLLAVLPPASRDSLPKPFHSLMTDQDSAIIDFYPDHFETDLNGKRQEWEAVVLIPFIDEVRLINAMYLPLSQLTPEERNRNTHGPMQVYRYSDKGLGLYYAPKYFPTIQVNYASCSALTREAIYIPRNKLVKGLCKNTAQGVYYPGFPTMRHLEYKSKLIKKKVRVFDQASRDYNMILSIEHQKPDDEERQICDIAQDYLGKTVFARWPHLTESKVVAVSNEQYRYDITADGKGYNVIDNQSDVKQYFLAEKSVIETYYMERSGIDVGQTTVLIHVRELVGRRYEFLNEGKIRVNFAKEYAMVTSAYPMQMIVKDVNAYDDPRSNYQDLCDLFQDGTICFMLGQPHYGSTGKVIQCQESFDKGRIKVQMQVTEDPDFSHLHYLNDSILNDYYSQYSAATRLALSTATLARITGTVLVGRGASKNQAFEEASKANVGLNLKNGRKNQGIPGYVKSIDSKWYYSEKCLHLVDSYRREFFSFFQFLNSASSNSLAFEIDIFPEDKGDGTTLKKMQEWLNKQPYSSLEMQNCNSMSLETEVIQKIENTIDLCIEQVQHKQIKMTVRPHLIHIPGLISGNLSADRSATFELFDRVVNIRECYTVPMGYTGTVIAVHKVANDTFDAEKKKEVLVDILYDKPFPGGLSLNNCSLNRGYRMSPNDLINKSHGNRQLNLHLDKNTPNYSAYKPKQPAESSPGSAFVTWNNSVHTKFANGHTSHSNHQNIAPSNRGSPAQLLQTMQPITANLSNIPPMLVNAQINNSHGVSENVAFNSNNIPYYVPPHVRNNLPPPVNNYNQSNNVQLFDYSNSASNSKDNSPKKPFVVNRQSVQINSPSKSPERSVQTELDSSAKEFPTKEEIQVKIERRPANNQPGTEMLRNLLRLNEKENHKIDQNSRPHESNSVDTFFQMAQSSQSTKSAEKLSNTQQPSVSSSSTSSIAPSTATHQLSPPRPPQVKEFPSAQLLSFFVAHGMGCPTYTYSHLQGGYKAEVHIPTNHGSNMVVVSALCGSQNAATELVAAETLQQLRTVDLSIFMPELPPMPNPPKQWCTDIRSIPGNSYHGSSYNRAAQMEKSPRHSEPIRRSNVTSSTASERSDLGPRNVSFVPLQVTRKHFGKSTGSARMDTIIRNTSDLNSKKHTKSRNQVSPQQKESEPHFQQVNIPSGQQRPKYSRQMRLAANFNVMPI